MFCATWISIWKQFEKNCMAAGGTVHWARDADEANGIIVGLIKAQQAKEVIKVKTMTSDEVCLNRALEAAGITPYETDLADLIVQLGEDKPSHIVVPALHRNRMEIRQIFLDKMNLSELSDKPEDLAAAARSYLREKFLRVPVAISGANFAVAETGSVCVVESEGNGRMCVSLPRVLISLIGIEKMIPTFQDLEVYLQTLPRSATGERMNPYNSIWTGVTPDDGPQEFHVVLLDNGRTKVLARPGSARNARLYPLRRLSRMHVRCTGRPVGMRMGRSTAVPLARFSRRNCNRWSTRKRCPTHRHCAARAMKSAR